MKRRRFLVGLATLLVAMLMSISVIAAPTTEDWRLGSFANGTAYIYYTINPTNLQVESFTIVNNSAAPVMLRIWYDGFTDTDIIFSFTAFPDQTITKTINNFKFHRTPLNDPDPGSIRYPNKTYIGTRYG